MQDLWQNPAVNTVAVLLIVGLGGVLVKVLTLWSAKLSQLIDLTHIQNVKLDSMGQTAIKTETLVNSQRSELRAEIEELKVRLDASQLAKEVATETASKIAMQAAKDLAAQMAQQMRLASELEQALATAKTQAETAATLAATLVPPTLPTPAVP
jgi:hypothetical protein